MLIYVDDIIVTTYSSQAILVLLKGLRSDFAMKNLGNLRFFLGIEVETTEDGIYLSQTKYALDILKKIGMVDCEPCTMPLPAPPPHSGGCSKQISDPPPISNRPTFPKICS